MALFVVNGLSLEEGRRIVNTLSGMNSRNKLIVLLVNKHLSRVDEKVKCLAPDVAMCLAWENAIFCLFPSLLQNFFAIRCHFPLFSVIFRCFRRNFCHFPSFPFREKKCLASPLPGSTFSPALHLSIQIIVC